MQWFARRLVLSAAQDTLGQPRVKWAMNEEAVAKYTYSELGEMDCLDADALRSLFTVVGRRGLLSSAR